MPLFYVKIRKNIDICNYLPIYYPAICRGWGTFSVPSMGEIFDAYYRVGFGFPNELNYEDKRHRQLPAYSKTFVMDDLAELSQEYGVNAKDNH